MRARFRSAGSLDFHVIHTTGSTLDDRPTERDLTIPKEEKEAAELLKRQLHLEDLAKEGDKIVLGTVSDFFLRRFEYSTYLEKPADPGRSPVRDFLLKRRKGHCEYFATASCLFLRAAGNSNPLCRGLRRVGARGPGAVHRAGSACACLVPCMVENG